MCLSHRVHSGSAPREVGVGEGVPPPGAGRAPGGPFVAVATGVGQAATGALLVVALSVDAAWRLARSWSRPSAPEPVKIRRNMAQQ